MLPDSGLRNKLRHVNWATSAAQKLTAHHLERLVTLFMMLHDGSVVGSVQLDSFRKHSAERTASAEQGVGAPNATNSGRRRLRAASATPQTVTVYYDLAGVPQGQASSAQNTLNSDTSALVAAANKQGAMSGRASHGSHRDRSYTYFGPVHQLSLPPACCASGGAGSKLLVKAMGLIGSEGLQRRTRPLSFCELRSSMSMCRRRADSHLDRAGPSSTGRHNGACP